MAAFRALIKKPAVKAAVLVAWVLPFLVWYVNCAPQTLALSESDQGSSDNYSSTLALNPSQQTIAPNTSLQLKTVGGVPPYSFSVLSGGGAVDKTTGDYVAPATSTTAEIEVRDSNGEAASATVIVTSQAGGATTLSVSASVVTINTGQSTVISATGGTPPYKIQLASIGMGVLNGFTFNAGSVGGNAWIRIIDTAGVTALINITIKDIAPDTAAVYQAYSGAAGDHLYSTGTTEGVDGGYGYEGAVFKIMNNLQLNSGPLYRCKTVVSGKHFLSRGSSCDGVGNLEFILGYIYITPKSGTVQLYRYYNQNNADRIVVTDLAAGNKTGYFLEGSLGWVYPP
jgi:hypothetical protein